MSVEVTDDKGHYVNGLTARDFRLWEDGIIQRIIRVTEQGELYKLPTYLLPIPTEGSARCRFGLCPMHLIFKYVTCPDTGPPQSQSRA